MYIVDECTRHQLFRFSAGNIWILIRILDHPWFIGAPGYKGIRRARDDYPDADDFKRVRKICSPKWIDICAVESGHINALKYMLFSPKRFYRMSYSPITLKNNTKDIQDTLSCYMNTALNKGHLASHGYLQRLMNYYGDSSVPWASSIAAAIAVDRDNAAIGMRNLRYIEAYYGKIGAKTTCNIIRSICENPWMIPHPKILHELWNRLSMNITYGKYIYFNGQNLLKEAIQNDGLCMVKFLLKKVDANRVNPQSYIQIAYSHNNTNVGVYLVKYAKRHGLNYTITEEMMRCAVGNNNYELIHLGHESGQKITPDMMQSVHFKTKHYCWTVEQMNYLITAYVQDNNLPI